MEDGSGGFDVSLVFDSLSKRGALRPMRLDPIVRDFPGFVNELVEALESGDTFVYLDTSLLMWFLRVESEVRAEFLAWCDERPAGTVRIPVWVAHELHRHLHDRTEFKHVQSAIGKVKVGNEALGELAAERAADNLCRLHGYTGRDAFVGDVEATLEKLDKFMKTISLGADTYQNAAEEIVAFVNQHLLSTNLARITQELSLTGRFRVVHRIPPGFMETKEENPHGDIIIWEEIVEDLAAAGLPADGGPRRAVFVTRDEKEDWVSNSAVVQLEPGKSRGSNPKLRVQVKRPHPLLMHELSVRAQGAELYITHSAFLAGVLQKLGKKRGGELPVQWWRASYRHSLWAELEADAAWGLGSARLARDRGPGEAGGNAAEAVQGEPVPPALPQPAPPALPSGKGAAPLESAVSLTEATGNRVSEYVTAYLSTPPGTESSVVEGWMRSMDEGRITPFALGTIFAQLAVSGPAGWTAQVRPLLGRVRAHFGDEALNQVVLALAGAAYFGANAELRKRPHRAIGEVVLALESDEALVPAFTALNRFLVEADASLVYVPGSGRASVEVEVVASRSGRSTRLVHAVPGERLPGACWRSPGGQPPQPDGASRARA